MITIVVVIECIHGHDVVRDWAMVPDAASSVEPAAFSKEHGPRQWVHWGFRDMPAARREILEAARRALLQKS